MGYRQRHRAVEEQQLGQKGLITRSQLKALGLSLPTIRRWAKEGELVHVLADVYGAPWVDRSLPTRALAAVLASGKTAFASHDLGAALRALPLPEAARLEVTTVLERRPRPPGVRMHRSGLLAEGDVVDVDGVPTASTELTIIQLSGRLSGRHLGRLTDDAVRRDLTTLDRIAAANDRLPHAPGRSPAKMRAVLDRRVPGVEIRESVLEDFVFDALRRFGLPLPVAQYAVNYGGQPRTIDLCYPPPLQLALEAQGFEYHRGRDRFDQDALRENELQLLGYRVLTFTSAFTDWQIADHVARALGLPSAPRPKAVFTFASWLARR